MSEESLNVTIRDMPTEIIERFIPSLDPKTISTLKLVSKQFYNVFNQDRFYKYYLIYPEEYYLSDLEFESKATNVTEVVEKIKNEVYGKWEGFYRLQVAHLKNVRCCRLDNVDIINVQGGKLEGYYELSDESNGSWLCCEFDDGKITLINFATKQELHYKLKFRKIYIVQKIVLLELSDFEFAVYKLIKQEGTYTLQLQIETSFLEDMPTPENPVEFMYVVMSGKSKSSSKMKTVLAGAVRNGGQDKSNDGTFVVYDTESNTKSVVFLEDYDFPDYGIEEMYANQFPCLVLLLIEFERQSERTIVVFDVEANWITHCLVCSNLMQPIFFKDVKLITSNTIFVKFENAGFFYRLYPASPEDSLGNLSPKDGLGDLKRIYLGNLRRIYLTPRDYLPIVASSQTVNFLLRENHIHTFRVDGSEVDKQIHPECSITTNMDPFGLSTLCVSGAFPQFVKTTLPTIQEFPVFTQPGLLFIKSTHDDDDLIKACKLTRQHTYWQHAMDNIMLCCYPSRVVLVENSGEGYSFKVYYF